MYIYLYPLYLRVLVQHECIPQAILGMDVVCQAKSGMGKTAVFVLATLQQLEPVAGQVCNALIIQCVVCRIEISSFPESLQGACRSWKVVEFRMQIFQAWNVMQ